MNEASRQLSEVDAAGMPDPDFLLSIGFISIETHARAWAWSMDPERLAAYWAELLWLDTANFKALVRSCGSRLPESDRLVIIELSRAIDSVAGESPATLMAIAKLAAAAGPAASWSEIEKLVGPVFARREAAIIRQAIQFELTPWMAVAFVFNAIITNALAEGLKLIDKFCKFHD